MLVWGSLWGSGCWEEPQWQQQPHPLVVAWLTGVSSAGGSAPLCGFLVLTVGISLDFFASSLCSALCWGQILDGFIQQWTETENKTLQLHLVQGRLLSAEVLQLAGG